MLARLAQKQQLKQLSSKRMFSSSRQAFSGHDGGIYSNLPFKVKDRKIPYAVPHFAFFSMFHSIFVSCC
ncbi:unnamed protein product [Kuraishia capsulata CBS 1993]|uniref:Cytochrome c oxidase subunit 8, mitochondrial n=1 Tax=Kuraishia capsulata CBS 1993 TaxID=1382522 RepID=W6MUL5_9ASCO|nr:uncharacterized protein KUCA_T00001705001 [Kuraishia capsulata CBS 1993]CDK25735.1 unnamed protein product [Kuraishia capsulata CBS 1993]